MLMLCDEYFVATVLFPEKLSNYKDGQTGWPWVAINFGLSGACKTGPPFFPVLSESFCTCRILTNQDTGYDAWRN